MNNPIGIFDSGVGGLTVLDYMREQFPHENMIYIGDNAHCPYGDKTKEQLLSYTRKICEYFIAQKVKMIVLACNTTSANVLDELQKLYPQTPIVGVIHSTIHEFLARHHQNVLVIATTATIQSHKYRDLILEYDSQVQVHELATPKLVPIIESGAYKQGVQSLLSEYLSPYRQKIDALILGCTHYPILLEQIQEVIPDIDYISSSASICQEVASYLKNHQLQNQSLDAGSIRIYTTGNVDSFVQSSIGFFEYQHLKAKHLDLKKGSL